MILEADRYQYGGDIECSRQAAGKGCTIRKIMKRACKENAENTEKIK